MTRGESHTRILLAAVAGVGVEHAQTASSGVVPGVWPDMTEYGYEADGWPGLLPDDTRAGFGNDFTQRNTTIMTWNLMHMARLLRDSGGLPNEGNDRRAWEAGCRFNYENPDYRA